MFVSSEFDIFASKPLQESVHKIAKIVYKPIASVEQSDLEFLIPADNETHIDLDIKLHIRGKLTKVVWAAMNDKDFTSVTNNFFHSLFSQCSVQLKDTTFAQAT